jgi:hypothetical protein
MEEYYDVRLLWSSQTTSVDKHEFFLNFTRGLLFSIYVEKFFILKGKQHVEALCHNKICENKFHLSSLNPFTKDFYLV